jgi:hypothetical protein
MRGVGIAPNESVRALVPPRRRDVFPIAPVILPVAVSTIYLRNNHREKSGTYRFTREE